MIRVLHCVVGMNYGGYETFIMNVYRNIDKNKVQFDFLTSIDGVFDCEINDLGGRIYKIPFITKVGPYIYNRNLIKFFKTHSEYKIVHSHMDKFSGMIMRAADKCKIPIRIAHSHSTGNEGNIAYRVVKDYYGRYINKHCTHRFACSEKAGKWLFNNVQFKVIKNGINIHNYLPNAEVRKKIRAELGFDNKYVFGHVGRFNATKNHKFLIDVFNEIKKRKVDVLLLLVGDGELHDDIITYAKGCGIEKDLILFGTTNCVGDVLQSMDCFVFPSIHEGLGIALIEAQAAGLICIASDSVPSDADFSSTVKYLSLKESSAKWAEQILSHSPNISNIEQKIIKSGYDINSTANILELFYISHLEDYEKNTFCS